MTNGKITLKFHYSGGGISWYVIIHTSPYSIGDPMDPENPPQPGQPQAEKLPDSPPNPAEGSSAKP